LNVGVLSFGVPLLGQSDPVAFGMRSSSSFELPGASRKRHAQLTNTPSFLVSLPRWCSLVRLPLAACSDHMLLVLQDSEVLPKPGEQLGGVPMPAAMALRKRAPTYFGASIPLDQLHAAPMLSKHLRYKINVAVLTSTTG